MYGAARVLRFWWLGVEVQEEFVGVWADLYFGEFARAFVAEVVGDQVFGEDAAFEQEVGVAFERVERFGERARGAADVGFFFWREFVDVYVQRCRWLDGAFDAVKSGHEHGGEGEVGVTGWVWRAKFDAACFRRCGVGGDADGCRAVALRVDEVDGCFEAGDEAAVGVGGWGAECEECGGVQEEAADVVSGHFGEECVARFVEEEWLVVFPEALMDVHAASVVAKEWFGHEGGGVAQFARGGAYDVFVEHELVGHEEEWFEAHVDFALTGGGDFVVVDFDVDAGCDQVEGDV